MLAHYRIKGTDDATLWYATREEADAALAAHPEGYVGAVVSGPHDTDAERCGCYECVTDRRDAAKRTRGAVAAQVTVTATKARATRAAKPKHAAGPKTCARCAALEEHDDFGGCPAHRGRAGIVEA